MSQDNVEFVRRYYVKWNAGDMKAMAASLPEEIIIDLSRRKLDPEVLSGRDAALSFSRTWFQLWDSHQVEIERVAEIGDQVLLFVLITALGRGSRVPVQARVAHLWTFRDGVPVRLDYFAERAEALEAVGLSEQDALADS